MAKGSGVLHYTGKRGGRGQPNKTQKAWGLKKGQNNLICPMCHTTCDRKDVKIWLARNYGECPSCFKKVHFELHRPVGRPLGSKYTKNEVEPVVTTPIITHAEPEPIKSDQIPVENHKEIHTFSDYLERVKEIRNPCKYLSCEDITRLTSIPPRFIAVIKRKLKYKMYRGRRSELMEMLRLSVLTTIHEGFIPPDLKHFKE